MRTPNFSADLDAPRFIHAKPIHTHEAPSPLSKESAEQNYRGFVNLAVLFIGANMARLVIENFTRYGFLLTRPGTSVPLSDVAYLVLMGALLGAHLGAVFLIEKLALLHKAGLFAFCLACLNVLVLLLAAPWVIWTQMYHPCISGAVLFADLIFVMKSISYHAVNAELRRFYFAYQEHPDSAADELKPPYPACPYPANLTPGNFAYFLAAPTLCYQPVYPRIQRFRRTFFTKRCLECASALLMVYFAIEQFATPTVQNAMQHLDDRNVLRILERMLKLSPTSLYIWLLGFYAIFHSFFNAVAEVLRFGDRQFYHAWWNASSLDEYWRLWNAPVHLWLKRHIYIPLRARGCSPLQAQLVIFAISAFFHEYLVSVPTHSIQGWAFMAMLGQVPLIALTKQYLARHPKSSLGNYFFWITLCIFGQPMCVLLYYRSWIRRHD